MNFLFQWFPLFQYLISGLTDFYDVLIQGLEQECFPAALLWVYVKLNLNGSSNNSIHAKNDVKNEKN